MKQLMLWEEAVTDPWIGKRVLYHEKRLATVARALVTTTEWGTLYALQVDGEPFPFVAYEDEWRTMRQETSSPPLPVVLPSSMHEEHEKNKGNRGSRKG